MPAVKPRQVRAAFRLLCRKKGIKNAIFRFWNLLSSNLYGLSNISALIYDHWLPISLNIKASSREFRHLNRNNKFHWQKENENEIQLVGNYVDFLLVRCTRIPSRGRRINSANIGRPSGLSSALT